MEQLKDLRSFVPVNGDVKPIFSGKNRCPFAFKSADPFYKGNGIDSIMKTSELFTAGFLPAVNEYPEWFVRS